MMQCNRLMKMIKKKFEMIIEGLYIDAIDNEDFEVLNKYFG